MVGGPVRRAGELTFSMSLLVFSLLAFWQAFEISGFSSLSSAGAFPMLATGVMAAAMVVVVSQDRRKPKDFEGSALRRFRRAVLPNRFLIFCAMMVAYMLLLAPVGFALSTFVFLLVSILFLYRRGLLTSLLVAAGSTAVVYVIFRVVFSVVLPEGIWI